MIDVRCLSCGKLHHADPSYEGKMLRCGGCAKPVVISAQYQNQSSSKVASAISIERSSTGTRVFRAPRRFAKNVVALSITTVSIALLGLAGKHVASAYRTPRLHRTLASGTRLKPDTAASGHGVLSIDDAGGDDAIVKLVPNSQSHAIRTVYIRGGESLTLQDIPPGAYNLCFLFGDDWDPQKDHFTRPSSSYEAGKTLEFTEEQKADDLEYIHREITLNTHVGGNVSREPLSETEFNAL